jgi:hypothetical protein
VDEEKAVLLDFIRENYGNHTPEEIKLAFKMAVSGKLSVDPNCYENFSCQYFGKIMGAYRIWASSEIKFTPTISKMETVELPLPPADFTQVWEDILQAAREGRIEQKIIGVGIFEWLYETKQLDITPEQGRKYFEMAKSKYLAELTIERLPDRSPELIDWIILKNGYDLSESLEIKIANRAKVLAVKAFAMSKI